MHALRPLVERHYYCYCYSALILQQTDLPRNVIILLAIRRCASTLIAHKHSPEETSSRKPRENKKKEACLCAKSSSFLYLGTAVAVLSLHPPLPSTLESFAVSLFAFQSRSRRRTPPKKKPKQERRGHQYFRVQLLRQRNLLGCRLT